MLVAAVAAVLGWAGGLSRLDAAFYDGLSRLSPAPAARDVVLVAIDESSLARVGRWPWDRDRQVDLIERIAAQEPAALGLDLLLSEPSSDPEVDLRMAQAIARAGMVVLPVFTAQLPGQAARAMLPVPPLARAAKALGHVSVEADGDGVVRRVFLREGAGGQGWDHFAVALLDVAGKPPARPLPGRRAPADVLAGGASGHEWWRDHLIDIAYAGPAGTYATVPAADVLAGRVPDDLFKDKIVLFGSTASGLGDVYPTVWPGGFTPGVEISANIIGDLLQGTWRGSLAPPWAALLSASLAAVAIPALWILGPLWALAAAAGGVLLVLAVSGALLLSPLGLWFAPGAAMLAIVLGYLAWNWRRLQRAAGYLTAELARLRGQDPKLVERRRGGGDLIDRYIEDLAQARERLREAEQRRDQALRFLSHDIRAPQTAILALLDLHRADPDEVPVEELLTRIGRHAADTQGLAESFVELAKVATTPLKRDQVDCAEVLLDAADACWEQARKKRMEVDVDVPEDAALVSGDGALLRRAVINLIGNAVKYSEGPSRVACGLTLRDGFWRISVRDQGRGIPADQLGKLFGEFARIKPPEGASDEPGFGLGLAFSKAVTERHGGRIECDSVVGQGSEFRIMLPML